MLFLHSVLGFSQTTFAVDNINYKVTDAVLNTVSVTGGNWNDLVELTIPETVNYASVDYKVTRIAENAFKNYPNIRSVFIGDNVSSIGGSAFRSLKNMTKVTIGSSVSIIGELAFASAIGLTEMVVKSNTPPLLVDGKITSKNVNLTVPEGRERAYTEAGWNGFYSINGVFIPKVGFVFTMDGLRYRVFDSYLVVLLGCEDDVTLPNELSLPSTVPYSYWNFDVEFIANDAFKGKALEYVVIPNTVKFIRNGAFDSNNITKISLSEGLISIEASAFRNNKLSTVTLPSSLTGIGDFAFSDNKPLARVIAKGTKPASLGLSAFGFNWLLGTNEADLYVPEGAQQAYRDAAGWELFKSINSGAIGIAIKVYLEGALQNANEGEDMYMRDDLRKMGLLPTESPYTAGVTIQDAAVLSVSGGNAIVDWVYVELRDGNDNTTVLKGVSALLQRDGDIVAIDGVSNVEFEDIEPGSYEIAVYHRNHLGIKGAHPITLLPNSRIDFTVDPTNAEGEENSLIKVRDNVYALIGGDYDANDQVQNTDKNSVLPIIGASGYNRGDFDMNGQVQNTDITNIMNKNIGRGAQ